MKIKNQHTDAAVCTKTAPLNTQLSSGMLSRIIIPHILLIILTGIILFVPKKKQLLHASGPLLAAICIIEILFLLHCMRAYRQNRYIGNRIYPQNGHRAKRKDPKNRPTAKSARTGGTGNRDSQSSSAFTGICDIMVFVWTIMILWELFTAVLDLAHPVLVPAPENVFFTFYEHWRVMLLNIAYSLELLLTGMIIGLALAIILGLFCGWIPRLKAFAYPIANVLAPIPAVVISPYLVSLMPTFRSASALVVVLGVFWPQFLGTINRIGSIEPEILDSARMLNLSTPTMLFKILLPYLIPGILTGLKVTMTTSILMLNFAELMGATHGMGYYIQNSITYANYAHAVAGIIVIGVVVTILNRVVGLIQKKFIRWH
ncbi:MAG: ABC transporter permease subunit [Eubacterium sp.]|nr:ABC transporter permease subunit [Eubacterium sp.]